MSMRVHVRSLMPCSVEQMWQAIQSRTLLTEVTPGGKSLARADAASGALPASDRWTDESRIVLRLPRVGERVIEVTRVDPASHVIQTREHDRLVRRWHHTMAVAPGPEGQAWYSDTVDIDAGRYTLPVFLLAQCLYRTRHRGWRRIAGELARGTRSRAGSATSDGAGSGWRG